MNLEEYKDKQIIFVTPNNTKINTIIENSHFFLNIKYMTKEEYMSKYFFSYTNKTLDYLITKYNYNLDFAKIIINNLYVIDINKEYKNTKLIDLQNIKKDLLDNSLLEEDLLFRDYIKDKLVIVYNYSNLEKYEEEVFHDALIINKEIKEITSSVYHCNTLEEELLFVIGNILKLVKSGISLNDIVIGNVSSEYLYPMYKMFSYFNIPINIDMNEYLYGTSIVKEYLESKKLPGFVNPIVKGLTSVINSLVDIEDSPNYEMFLIDKLKTTKIPSKKYKNAVRVSNELFYVGDDKYLFVVGFNSDVLPKIKKDEDYISDSLKEEVSLYSTNIINQKEKNNVCSIISNTKNIYLSYKDRNNFNEYLKSSLIDEKKIKIIDYYPSISNSNLYNKIILGEKLDTFYKYNEKDKFLIPLLSHYNIPYNTYDNKFKCINKDDLYKYINYRLKVSYTSLNSYYECKFKYYVNYILKIDPFESNFSTVIGNLFHYIFSVMDNPLFNLEREWNNYIEKLELSVKERFFLENLKEDLITDIELIKDQDNFTDLKNKLYEQEVNIKLNKNIDTTLTGKIDKVMYNEFNNNILVSVIDYKTGSITTNINNLKYGLSMQLPIYLYLIHKSNIFTNPRIVGIYLQKVLNSSYSFDSKKTKLDLIKDGLKLRGYSNSDIDILEKFDKTYENSELIKSMKTTKDGNFSRYSKVLSDDDFSKIIDYIDKKINEAVDSILDGDFLINPKVIDKDNISCKYCRYKDICFMTNNDIKYLDKVEDLSFLGGEDNGMD